MLRIRVAVAASILCLLTGLSGCAPGRYAGAEATTSPPDTASPSEEPTSSEPETTEPADVTVTVLYEVEGEAEALYITYDDIDGSHELEGEPGPWEHEFEANLSQSGSVARINAVAEYPDTMASVTCRITIDGQVVAEHTSYSAFCWAEGVFLTAP